MSFAAYQPSLDKTVVLASNVLVDFTSTNAQNICQLAPPSSTTAPGFPANLSFVITGFVARPTAAVNAATTFNLGWNATSATGSSNVLSASTGLQSAASNKATPVSVAAQTVGPAGQYLTITPGGTLTSNAGVYVDVLGYFTGA